QQAADDHTENYGHSLFLSLIAARSPSAALSGNHLPSPGNQGLPCGWEIARVDTAASSPDRQESQATFVAAVLRIRRRIRMRQRMVTGQMTRFITDQPQAVKTLPDANEESATEPNRMMS